MPKKGRRRGTLLLGIKKKGRRVKACTELESAAEPVEEGNAENDKEERETEEGSATIEPDQCIDSDDN
jgi:hypothetical protein